MILRRRNMVAEPAILGPTSVAASKERAKATMHYGAHPPPTKNITFKVYSSDEVRELLNQLFGTKCAYCEGVLQGLMPMDVEHFRPKGEIVTAAGAVLFPGYWWLASSWENLLPSCIDCNRQRWHKSGNAKYRYGKQNRFPLAEGCPHATTPNAIANEVPLLIDPAAEDPAIHLDFGFVETPAGIRELLARPKILRDEDESEKGRTSIEVHGLNRPGLAAERKRRVDELAFALDNMAERWTDAHAIGGDAGNARREKIRADIRKLTRLYLSWRSPYAAACRAYFNAWRRELEARRAIHEELV